MLRIRILMMDSTKSSTATLVLSRYLFSTPTQSQNSKTKRLTMSKRKPEKESSCKAARNSATPRSEWRRNTPTLWCWSSTWPPAKCSESTDHYYIHHTLPHYIHLYLNEQYCNVVKNIMRLRSVWDSPSWSLWIFFTDSICLCAPPLSWATR